MDDLEKKLLDYADAIGLNRTRKSKKGSVETIIEKTSVINSSSNFTMDEIEALLENAIKEHYHIHIHACGEIFTIDETNKWKKWSNNIIWINNPRIHKRYYLNVSSIIYITIDSI